MFYKVSQAFPKTVRRLSQTVRVRPTVYRTDNFLLHSLLKRKSNWVPHKRLTKVETNSCFPWAFERTVMKEQLPNSARFQKRWQSFITRNIKNRWKNVKKCSLDTRQVLADNHHLNYLFPVPVRFSAYLTANMNTENEHFWQHIFLKISP